MGISITKTFSFWKKEEPFKVKEGTFQVRETTTSPEMISIEPYETFKIHDLANMFPFNITPALIESKIQHAIAAKQRMFNSLTPQMAFLIIALLVGSVLAGYMAWKFFVQGSGTAQEVKVTIDYAGNLIGTSVQNLTG